MKRARGKFFARVLFVASICLMGACFLHVKHFFTRIDEYSYAIDSRFSPPMRMALGHFFEHDQELKDLSPDQLYEFLKKNFSCIHSCQVQRVRPGMAHVVVQAEDPFCVVNNTQVVTAAATIVAASCYEQRLCHALPHIVCAHQLSVQDAIGMVAMPKLLARAYAIDWHSEHEIWLRNAVHESFAVVCSIDALPSLFILQACEKMREQVELRIASAKSTSSAKGGVKKQWVADVRFDKQIILFPVQEGVSYG